MSSASGSPKNIAISAANAFINVLDKIAVTEQTVRLYDA